MVYLKNFTNNFVRQFNEPSCFGLYKVLANNIEQGVDNLRTMLQSREKPESKQQLAETGGGFEYYLPRQKNDTSIDPEKVERMMGLANGVSFSCGDNLKDYAWYRWLYPYAIADN